MAKPNQMDVKKHVYMDTHYENVHRKGTGGDSEEISTSMVQVHGDVNCGSEGRVYVSRKHDDVSALENSVDSDVNKQAIMSMGYVNDAIREEGDGMAHAIHSAHARERAVLVGSQMESERVFNIDVECAMNDLKERQSSIESMDLSGGTIRSEEEVNTAGELADDDVTATSNLQILAGDTQCSKDDNAMEGLDTMYARSASSMNGTTPIRTRTNVHVHSAYGIASKDVNMRDSILTRKRKRKRATKKGPTLGIKSKSSSPATSGSSSEVKVEWEQPSMYELGLIDHTMRADVNNISIASSDVAAVCGLNPHTQPGNLLFKYVYKGFRNLMFLDAANVGIEIVSEDERMNDLIAQTSEREILQSVVKGSKDGTVVKDVVDVASMKRKAEKALEMAIEKKELPQHELTELKHSIQYKLYTSFGNRKENLALVEYEKKTGYIVGECNEHCFAMTVPTVCTEKSFKMAAKGAHTTASSFSIVGFVDGLAIVPSITRPSIPTYVSAVSSKLKGKAKSSAKEVKTSTMEENTILNYFAQKQYKSSTNSTTTHKATAAQPLVLDPRTIPASKPTLLFIPDCASPNEPKSTDTPLRTPLTSIETYIHTNKPTSQMSTNPRLSLTSTKITENTSSPISACHSAPRLDNSIVVEIKNRANGRIHTPPRLYEQIQLLTYLKLTNLKQGDLVQYVARDNHEDGPLLHISRISLESDQFAGVWEKILVPRLSAFCQAVHQVRQDDRLRTRLIMLSTSEYVEEQNKFAEQLCPSMENGARYR
eukprot:CFRG7789T1